MISEKSGRQRELIRGFLQFAGDNWDKTFPKHIAGAWLEELDEYPLTLLEAAFKLARRHKFMPNIGDIVEIIEKLRESERMSAISARPLCLDRGDKPPGWEQSTSEDHAALYEKFKSRLEIVAQDRRMPEAKRTGPEKQFRKLQQQKAKLLAEEPQKTMSDSEDKKEEA
jgi:hypothetical protein